MRTALFASAAFACAASTANAAEPTLEQLLAKPTPSEIVAKWKAVCFDNAGDPKAQKRAAKDLRIDWPYQAAFDGPGGKPGCMIVSSTGLDATAQAFGDAITQASSPHELQNVKLGDRNFSASTVINGSVFQVRAQIAPSQGVATAVVALIDLKEKR
jgi:hypothetical protein